MPQWVVFCRFLTGIDFLVRIAGGLDRVPHWQSWCATDDASLVALRKTNVRVDHPQDNRGFHSVRRSILSDHLVVWAACRWESQKDTGIASATPRHDHQSCQWQSTYQTDYPNDVLKKGSDPRRAKLSRYLTMPSKADPVFNRLNNSFGATGAVPNVTFMTADEPLR